MHERRFDLRRICLIFVHFGEKGEQKMRDGKQKTEDRWKKQLKVNRKKKKGKIKNKNGENEQK